MKRGERGGGGVGRARGQIDLPPIEKTTFKNPSLISVKANRKLFFS